MASKFPNLQRTFRDTLGRGRIVVRGFTLEADEDGFIEGPADLAPDLAPHGFMPMPRPAKSGNTLSVPKK